MSENQPITKENLKTLPNNLEENKDDVSSTTATETNHPPIDKEF